MQLRFNTVAIATILFFHEAIKLEMGLIWEGDFSMNVYLKFFFKNVNLRNNFEQFPSVVQS